MPRQARKKSESGIYHVLLKGINRQTIFEDEEDSNMFLRIIGIYKAEFNSLIYAYCLMRNHIHLLVHIGGEDLSAFMRKIGAKYVFWYNWKYDRIGGLFQDRYKSEPVEDDSYFLKVLRYIHQNPVKAGICETVAEFKESSYNDYIYPRAGSITDTEFALSLLSREQFARYHNESSEEICLEIREIKRFSDSEAQALIRSISHCGNAAEFQTLPREERNLYLAELKTNGVPIRQIERLTGINRGIVQKA